MTGAHILGGDYLTLDHRVLVGLDDLAGDALADDLLRALVHQGIGGADDLVVRFHRHIVLVGQGVADTDGGLVAGDVQLHHLVLAQADAVAIQEGGQALGLGGVDAGLAVVLHGDGAAGGQDLLHGLVAQAAAQQQVVVGALLAALVQHMGAVAVHHDVDGVQRAHRLCGHGDGEDRRGDGDHGDDADGGVVAHDVVHLPQGRRAQRVAAGEHQPAAAEALIAAAGLGGHGVPGPGQTAADGAEGPEHGAARDVGRVVDGLAHGDRRDVPVGPAGLQALRLSVDGLFHSTSQYSRRERVLNRGGYHN